VADSLRRKIDEMLDQLSPKGIERAFGAVERIHDGEEAADAKRRKVVPLIVVKPQQKQGF
jgi:hypothetical protein